MTTAFPISVAAAPRSEAEAIARIKGVKARCYLSGTQKAHEDKPRVRTIMRLPEWFTPEWKRSPTKFDRHVLDWKEWETAPPVRQARMFAALQAEILGLSYDELVADKRRVYIVLMRDKIAFEMAERWTRLSNDDIGMVLGRDCSSVRSMIRREAKRRGVPLPKREPSNAVAGPYISAREARASRVDWVGVESALRSGEVKQVVADRFGVSLRTLYRVRKERGWP